MSSSKRSSKFAASVLLVAGQFAGVAYAGIPLVLDFGGNTADLPRALHVGADDRVYVDISTGAGAGCGTFALDANGSLLVSFADRGRLQLPSPPATCLTNALVRPDGSIVSFTGSVTLPLFVLGANGAVQSTFPQVATLGYENYYGIAASADGKILVAGGLQGPHVPGNVAWLVRRFNVDGSLDNSFASGRLQLSISGSSGASETARHSVALPDGKLLVSGNSDGNSVLLRLNADGSSDATFGLNGQVEFPGGTALLDVDSTGRAYLQTGAGGFTRINTAGSVDATYQPQTSLPDVVLTGAKLDSADRLVVFGIQLGGSTPTGYIARYTTAGALDATFGTGGTILADLVTSPDSLTYSDFSCVGGVQSNDRIVFACNGQVGSDAGQTDTNLVMWRYNLDGSPDLTFGASQENSDVYPDNFTFSAKSAPYGTALVESGPVTITGINSKARFSTFSTHVEVSFGCTGIYITPDVNTTIQPGQHFCLRGDASSTPLGVANYDVTVGGRTATFTITSTNQPADVVPDAFSFTNKTDVALSSVVTSSPAQISGINGRAPVTVNGGTFSIGCVEANYGAMPAQVTSGQTVCVRHTSSSLNSSSVATTLTVGGQSATFTSTTLAAPTPPPPTSGPPADSGASSGGGGSMDGTFLMLLALVAGISGAARWRVVPAPQERRPIA
jgi:uncharacterized delta-60 repeat protein